jgi:hypothetical protein
VTLSYAASSPYPFATNGNYEWHPTVSETGNGIQFRLKAGTTSGFYVDNNTGRLWGNTGGTNGQAVSITVEAVRNGEVVATSNTISGTVYSTPEIGGSNYWGGQVATMGSGSLTLNVNGGRAPYTWTMKSGSLPTWAEAVESGNNLVIRKKSSETVTATPRTSAYFEVRDADGRVMKNNQPAGYKIDIEAY